MNIKSLLAIAAAVATAGVVSAAEVNSDNELCRIAVPCTGAAIVAVPVMTVGGETQAIAPTNFVLSSSLNNGATMMQWDKDNSRWNVWTVTSGEWVASKTVKGTETADSPAPYSEALTTGEAVWITTTTTTIYVYGQVTSGATREFLKGTSTAPVYTLIGNPHLTATQLTTAKFSSASDGDQIVWVGAGATGKKMYTYQNGHFGHYVGTVEDGKLTTTWTTIDAETVTIDPGIGIWYVSRGGSGTATL